MRWKISHHGHDPRQVDLLAIVVLIVAIVGAYSYFSDRTEPPQSSTALIVPSQHVRW
jgi:predicted ribosomally synthesized peptide with SipW-like signal peptide